MARIGIKNHSPQSNAAHITCCPRYPLRFKLPHVPHFTLMSHVNYVIYVVILILLFWWDTTFYSKAYLPSYLKCISAARSLSCLYAHISARICH